MSVPIVWVLFLDQDTSLNSTTLKDSSLQVRRSKTTVNSLSDVRDIVASFLQLIFYSGLSTSKAQFQVLILDKISPSSPLHNQVSCIVCLSEANRKESRPSKSLRYFYKHMLLPKRIEVVPFNIGLTWFDDEHTSAGQQLPWIVKMATSVVDLPFLIGQHFGSRSDTSALCPQTIASPPGDKSRNTCVCYWNSASTINSVSLETAASKWRVDGMHLLLAAFGICLHEELTLRKSPAVSLTVRVHMIENKQWLTQLVKIVHDHSWNEVIERIAHESISDPEIESLNGQEVSGIQGHKLPFVHFTETKEESDKAKGSSFGVEQVKSQLWSPIRCTGSFMMIKSSGQINSEGYGGVARALPFIAQPQSSPYSGVSMTCLVDEQQLVVCLVASSTMFDEDELRVFTARYFTILENIFEA